jgi:hypothetical protein
LMGNVISTYFYPPKTEDLLDKSFYVSLSESILETPTLRSQIISFDTKKLNCVEYKRDSISKEIIRDYIEDQKRKRETTRFYITRIEPKYEYKFF